MELRQAAALAALAFAPALAQAQGFVELGFGQATYDLSEVEDLGFTLDDKDTTFAISGGYMFHPMIGAEIGFRDLGGVKGTIAGPGGTGTIKVDVSGVFFGLLGRVAVTERLSVVPRFGFYMWELEASGSVTSGGFVFLIPAESDSGTDPYFGIGARYAVSKQVHVGVHYAQFDIGGDEVDVIELKFGINF